MMDQPTFHGPTGLWYPWNEPRAQKMYDGLMKYVNDTALLLDLLPKAACKRACFQAGGHIGVWPLRLAPRFRTLYTFEPDPPVYAALLLNVEKQGNIEPIHAAVGERQGIKMLSYYSGRTAVSSIVDVKDEGDLHAQVTVHCIDDFDEDVAAIVLDIEGYEPWALRGAKQTIQRCRPLIQCEMLKQSKPAILQTMLEMDYFPVDNPRNRKCRDVVFAYGGKP
jgi:FkbM family methyltransferase